MHNNGKITSQILKNLDRVRRLVMKPRSHHTPPHIYNKFKDKHSIKKRDKVSFAEKLEVIHKLPYDNDFHRNYNCGFQLPQIDAHKYTPLVCRDPYAKPSKKKPRDKFEGMFIGDTARLPFIGLRSVDNFGQKNSTQENRNDFIKRALFNETTQPGCKSFEKARREQYYSF